MPVVRIANLKHKTVRSVVVRVRRVNQFSGIRIQAADHAVRRAAKHRKRDRVTIDVASCQRDRQRRIFGRRNSLRISNRWIVHWVHPDGHRRRIACAGWITHFKREGVRSIGVRVRRIDELPRRRVKSGDRSVRRPRHHRVGQHIAIDVRRCQRNRYRRVLRCRRRLLIRHRRVVCRCYRHLDECRVYVSRAVLG